MKSSNQNFLKNKSNFVYLLILFISFLLFVIFNRQKLFQRIYSDSIGVGLGVVNKYLKSQDILDIENKIKDRVFVSDEEIYIASGYLYANGAKPTEYNFQHPPFIKYLFGISSKYFNMPLLPNMFLGFILLLEVYFLGYLMFKNRITGLLGSLILLLDPVFKEVTIYALLDLGQMVFILGFLITTLYFKKHWIFQGILLGLAMASKFYSPVIIFLGIIYLYKLVTKQFNLKIELLVLSVSLLVFSLTYIASFPFNIIFHQAKIIKFMLDHNQAIEWGGVIPMFFGGYFIWPVLFFVNLYQLFSSRVSDVRVLTYILPTIYYILMCFQLPFTRYFILILPFLYLALGKFIISTWIKMTPRTD